MVEFSLVQPGDFEEEPQTPELIRRQTEPAPGKQFLAGLSRLATGIPGFPGAVYEGVGAAKDALTTDEGFLESFVRRSETNPLIQASNKLNRGVTDFLGVDELPVFAEDQIAGLLGSFAVPVPGAALGSGAGKLAALLTPVVRTTTPLVSKGNALRFGTQLGVATALDQGIRSIGDGPSHILSDEALRGSVFENLPSLPSISSVQASEVNFSVVTPEDELVELPVSPHRDSTHATDLDLDRELERQQTSPLTTSLVTGFAIAAAFAGLYKFNQLRNRTSTAEKAISIPGTNIGIKGRQTPSELDIPPLQSGTSQPIFQQHGETTTIKNEVTRLAEEIHGKLFDGKTTIRQALRNAGEDVNQISQLVGLEVPDSVGRSLEEIRNRLGNAHAKFHALAPEEQAIINDASIVLGHEHPARIRGTINEALAKDKHDRLPPEIRQAFNENDLTKMEVLLEQHKDIIARVRGKEGEGRFERVAPGMSRPFLGGGREAVPDVQLNARVEALTSNPKLMAIAREIADGNRDILQTFVSRGVKTQEDVDRLFRGFTTKNGLFYIPGKENIDNSSFFGQMAKAFGFHTTKGREMIEAGEMHALALKQGKGIQSPMNPLNASAEYLLHMIQHRDLSVAQWEHYSRLAGVALNDVGEVVERNPGTFAKAHMNGKLDGQEVHFVAKADRNGNLVWNNLNDKIKDTFRIPEGTPALTMKEFGDNVTWVERGGSFYGFFTENKGLKTALEFNHELHNNFERFMNSWKNVFTQFTTGKYSVFAPTSFAYQQQIGSIVAAIRAGSFSGGINEFGKTWIGSFKGAYQLFAGNVARDIADITALQIEKHTAMGRAVPQSLQQTKARMERIVRNSMIEPIQAQVGTLATSLQASDTRLNISNAMKEALPFISEKWGANALPMLGRVWKHANQALHEGTAYGLYLRKIHERGGLQAMQVGTLSGQQLRNIADEVKLVTGDVRVRGTSDFARLFNAAVPFSGAMLQAWSVLGKAVAENPGNTLKMLSALVAAPAAMELTYNHIMPGDTTFEDPVIDKSWTYQDYYWNGFTSEQRNNNSIWFVPGKPPWEAVLVPIVPELTLVRSILIEGMDALFGLSKIGNTGVARDNGHHVLASLTRIFDVPVPPVISAGVTLTFGTDFRVGPNFDPPEGGDFSLFTAIPYTSGQKVTGKYGREKYINQELDTRTTSVIQDLLGAGGAALVALIEGFGAGKGDPERSLTEKAMFGLGEGLQQVQAQARFTQPIFGQAIHPTSNNEVAGELFRKREALTRAEKDIDAFSKPNFGNALQTPEDQLYFQFGALAKGIKAQLKDTDETISALKLMKSHIGGSTIDPFEGKPLTPRRRKDFLDAIELKISENKARQLLMIKQHEDEFSEYYQRPIVFENLANRRR